MNDDGTATLRGYDINQGGINAVIPETVNGATVTAIADGAFGSSKTGDIEKPGSNGIHTVRFLKQYAT